ncbi:MAG: hypothetical protein LBP26_07355 [Clostridiales bacterium]|jgi:hypothetical protein|nr:hypothetical protein [Clostridiales bacterium]
MKRLYLKIIGAVLAAAAAFPLWACNLSSVKPKITGPYNYYTSVYTKLTDADNVFRSIVWNGLDQLLDVEGATYIILFGGAHDEGTQEVIAEVNEYAKKFGVTNVYVFDFKLDGGLGESLGVNADISSPGHEYNPQYARILDKLTNYAAVSGNTETFSARIPAEVDANSAVYVKEDGSRVDTGTVIDLTPRTLVKIKTPTLLAFNKSLPGGPVIAVEDSDFAAGELNDGAKRGAYTARLEAFFKKAALGIRGNGTDSVKSDSFDYYCGENLHICEAPNNTPQSAITHILQPVTYHELIDMLEKLDSFPLLFGGEWCPNTQAIARYVNEQGKYYGVKKIYVFDTRIDGVSSQPANGLFTTGETGVTFNGQANGVRVKTGYYTTHPNIRGDFNDDGVIQKGETAYGRLYVKLLSYLPGFVSKWNDKIFGADVVDTVRIDSKNYTRICVPALIAYDKNNKLSDGSPSTVTASFESEYFWDSNAANPGTAGTSDLTSTAYRYTESGLKLFFERFNALYNPDFVPGGAKTDEESGGGDSDGDGESGDSGESGGESGGEIC